jgi:N-dimethylarginine dimethylaminohydrolase
MCHSHHIAFCFFFFFPKISQALTCIAPRTLAVEDNENAQAMFEELQKMTAQHFKSFQVSVAGAANTLWVGDTLLISSTLAGDLEPHFKQFAGEVVPVDISEFHKADGGLTCLSLIFEL